MTALEVRLFEDDGTTPLGMLAKRRGLRVVAEFNGEGYGEVRVPESVAAGIAYDQVVKVVYDGTVVEGFIVERKGRVAVAIDGQRWVTISGRGLMGWLADGTTYPQGGVTYNYSPTDRPFNFAGTSGHWYTLVTWASPLGVRQDDVATTDYRYKAPKGWPDPAAKWIWATDPEATVTANARNWFRTTLTVSAERKFKFYATADNFFELYLDGALIMSTADIQSDGMTWEGFTSRVITVPAGGHVIAAYVTNGASGSVADRAGFLFSMCMLTNKGKPSTVVRRSDVGNWYVTDDEPKWYLSEIIETLIDEASARGATRLDNLTVGWTDTLDSSGRAWATAIADEIPVGTNLLDLTTGWAVDHGVDFWFDPATLTLEAYETRGTDKSTTVALRIAKNLDTYDITGTATGATAALIRSKNGWTSASNAAGVTARGRRETFLEFGKTRSESTAASAGARILARMAKVDVAVNRVSCIPTPDARPFLDFNVGDRVTTVSSTGGKTTARVLALALVENESGGTVTYEPELEVLA